MILTLAMPDELYTEYTTHFPTGVNKGMVAQLKRFKDFPPTERALLFKPEERKELEKLFGRPIENGDELVKWIRGLLTLNVGGTEVPLTAVQQKLLGDEARFFKKEPAAYLAEKVKRGMEFAFNGAF